MNLEEQLDRIITASIEEDVAYGDITSEATVNPATIATATFLVKSSGIVSGMDIVQLIFRKMDASITCQFDVKNGDYIEKGTKIGTAVGSARSLLKAERLVLNIFQRMSGIATATNKMALELKDSKTVVLDTRKTAPGLRCLDKLAVLHGGGQNHRIGLYDMVLIKDNHITACKGVVNAILHTQSMFQQRGALNYSYKNEHLLSGIAVTPCLPYEDQTDALRGKHVEIEIEVDNLVDLDKVLVTGGVDRIMLDNMLTVTRDYTKTSSIVGEWVLNDKEVYTRQYIEHEVSVDVSKVNAAMQLVENARNVNNWNVKIEVSGNVVLDTIGAIGKTGVDYVSSGALTHSVEALDISMKIKL